MEIFVANREAWADIPFLRALAHECSLVEAVEERIKTMPAVVKAVAEVG